ncbi:ATP phosphoribosyltransferase regulatory subunit, partial [Patescibacteria group bacterium]|nr:ATP phosphoribosyltransferase regulatory subunit [Patescibacteria group bacterium]
MKNSGGAKITTEPYKGVRDFYPEDMAVQNYIFAVWREVSEKFGYQEYAASILEPADLYRQKSGDEIVNDQMYLFTDKGGREVALRPEMTPSLARMVAARRKSLKFPLRWYSIPNVFRYERPQRGRRREHWQLNCDLMGVINSDPVNAEVEIIRLAYEIMKKFGARDGDFEIQINSRKLLSRIYKEFNINEIEGLAVIKIIDRKLTEREKEEELKRVLPNNEKAVSYLMNPDTIENRKVKDQQLDESEENKQLLTLIDKLDEFEIRNVVQKPSIARGFDYYTGMVFEVFDT